MRYEGNQLGEWEDKNIAWVGRWIVSLRAGHVYHELRRISKFKTTIALYLDLHISQEMQPIKLATSKSLSTSCAAIAWVS